MTGASSSRLEKLPDIEKKNVTDTNNSDPQAAYQNQEPEAGRRSTSMQNTSNQLVHSQSAAHRKGSEFMLRGNSKIAVVKPSGSIDNAFKAIGSMNFPERKKRMKEISYKNNVLFDRLMNV